MFPAAGDGDQGEEYGAGNNISFELRIVSVVPLSRMVRENIRLPVLQRDRINWHNAQERVKTQRRRLKLIPCQRSNFLGMLLMPRAITRCEKHIHRIQQGKRDYSAGQLHQC